jgi:hypothetical protein
MLLPLRLHRAAVVVDSLLERHHDHQQRQQQQQQMPLLLGLQDRGTAAWGQAQFPGRLGLAVLLLLLVCWFHMQKDGRPCPVHGKAACQACCCLPTLPALLLLPQLPLLLLLLLLLLYCCCLQQERLLLLVVQGRTVWQADCVIALPLLLDQAVSPWLLCLLHVLLTLLLLLPPFVLLLP